MLVELDEKDSTAGIPTLPGIEFAQFWGGFHSLVLLEGGGVVSFGSGDGSWLGHRHGDTENQHTTSPRLRPTDTPQPLRGTSSRLAPGARM